MSKSGKPGDPDPAGGDADPADGRSEFLDRLARATPAGSELPGGDPTRAALASVMGAAEGRSALLEHFVQVVAAGNPSAEESRMLVEALTSTVAGADGRSALLEQLARALPGGGAAGGSPPTVAEMVASLLAVPEGRSALLQQLARAGDAGPATRVQPDRARPAVPTRSSHPGWWSAASRC